MLALPLRETSKFLCIFPSYFLSAGNVAKIENIEFLEAEFTAEGDPININLLKKIS